MEIPINTCCQETHMHYKPHWNPHAFSEAEGYVRNQLQVIANNIMHDVYMYYLATGVYWEHFDTMIGAPTIW